VRLAISAIRFATQKTSPPYSQLRAEFGADHFGRRILSEEADALAARLLYHRLDDGIAHANSLQIDQVLCAGAEISFARSNLR
jgi:hypothetical protein